MAYLRILHDGKEDLRELGQRLTIGRDAECDLRVQDRHISRVHCLIERHGDGWVVIDLDSHNGTKIGGLPLTRHTLRHGDVIELGAASLQFLRDEDARLASEAAQLLDEEGRSSAPAGAAPATSTTATLTAHKGPPRRSKSLWEHAIRPPDSTQHSKGHKRKRSSLAVLRSRLRPQSRQHKSMIGPTDTASSLPWYSRSGPLSLAVAAALGLLLILYFVANGFPTLSTSKPHVPASLPHSSPYNRD